MKAYLLLVLSILLNNTIFAQHQYVPIPEDSSIWISVIEDWHEGSFPPEPHTFSYSVGRTEGVDTVYNGTRYFCYYGEYTNGTMPPPPPKQYSAKVGQFVRQDTSTRKVWYLRTKFGNAPEELLYDFSLQKGDTIKDSSYYYFAPQRLYPAKAWIDDVDSIIWADGVWRYRYWIKSNYGPISNPAKAIMIEGMGYTTNFLKDPLLRYHPLINKTFELTCFGINDQWLYKENNPWNADCDTMILRNVAPVSVATLYKELEEPLLYPNPVANNGRLHINKYASISDKPLIIEAFNITGQKVISKAVKSGTFIPLSNYNLTSGQIYYFILRDEHANIIHKDKIIIL